MIKQRFVFQKTRLRGMVYNRYEVNVITTLTNLILALQQLVAVSLTRGCCGWGDPVLSLIHI